MRLTGVWLILLMFLVSAVLQWILVFQKKIDNPHKVLDLALRGNRIAIACLAVFASAAVLSIALVVAIYIVR